MVVSFSLACTRKIIMKQTTLYQHQSELSTANITYALHADFCFPFSVFFSVRFWRHRCNTFHFHSLISRFSKNHRKFKAKPKWNADDDIVLYWSEYWMFVKIMKIVPGIWNERAKIFPKNKIKWNLKKQIAIGFIFVLCRWQKRTKSNPITSDAKVLTFEFFCTEIEVRHFIFAFFGARRRKAPTTVDCVTHAHWTAQHRMIVERLWCVCGSVSALVVCAQEKNGEMSTEMKCDGDCRAYANMQHITLKQPDGTGTILIGMLFGCMCAYESNSADMQHTHDEIEWNGECENSTQSSNDYRER